MESEVSVCMKHAKNKVSSQELDRLLVDAYDRNDTEALTSVQATLANLHAASFDMPALPLGNMEEVDQDHLRARKIEARMIEYEDSEMKEPYKIVGKYSGKQFVKELKNAVRAHRASCHPYYFEYLPSKASVKDIAYYFAQESTLDPRFDDFIALMQIGLDIGPKMELAKNYWDEMGNGDVSSIHTTMFRTALDEVGAHDQYITENISTPALVCGNLSALLVLRKQYVYRAIGSFAVTEYLFPRRCSCLIEAWERLNLSHEGITYHREHMGIDARHAAGFFKNVITPLVDEKPEVATEIFWGAMARLNSSERHLDVMLHRSSEIAKTSSLSLAP